MNEMKTIQAGCAKLAGFRSHLRTLHEDRVHAINEINEQFAPDIQRVQQQCSATRAELAAQIEQNRALFTEPKTHEFYGITVGFEKERDALVYPGDEILVPRIREMLPKVQQESVLETTTTIRRQPLKKLGQKILQKLGITKKLGADQVVIRGNDDDIEALVAKAMPVKKDEVQP